MMRRIAGKKWLRWASAAMLAAGLLLFHAPLLRGLAAPLIVNQPTDEYDAVCISTWGETPDGDHCYNVAGEMHARKPKSRILLVVQPATRLEAIGVLPSFESLSRKELAARGVPADSLVILRGRPRNDRATAVALGAWLDAHPDARATLLCGQFRSAYVRSALDSSLDPAQAARVDVRALPSRRYDHTNWWKSRTGFQAFGINWLIYLHGLWYGWNTAEPAEKNADDYERDFLENLLARNP